MPASWFDSTKTGQLCFWTRFTIWSLLIFQVSIEQKQSKWIQNQLKMQQDLLSKETRSFSDGIILIQSLKSILPILTLIIKSSSRTCSLMITRNLLSGSLLVLTGRMWWAISDAFMCLNKNLMKSTSISFQRNLYEKALSNSLRKFLKNLWLQ